MASSRRLLPKHVTQFRSKQYWDQFFVDRHAEAFEWYGEYTQLQHLLRHHVASEHEVLVVGCGNSDLSSQMFDDGFRHMTSMDFSELVIAEMKRKNKSRAGMKWDVMDIMNMSYADSQFDCVLDKGALDAIATEDSAATASSVRKMFGEIARVLKVGGRYVCISLAQEHVLGLALDFFVGDSWRIEAWRVPTEEHAASGKVWFPFAFVFVKLEEGGRSGILSCLHRNTSSPISDDQGGAADWISREVLQVQIQEIQWLGMSRSDYSTLGGGKRTVLDLFDARDTEQRDPRFTLFVVDSDKRKPHGPPSVAVFIVPQGREMEWMFSTDEGQRQLMSCTDTHRLIIVHLNRGHSFGDLQSVQDELSPKMLELAPSRFSGKIPFMTVAEGVGERKLVLESTSEFSGDYVVEDCASEGKVLRRLIFKNNQNVIQSEVQLLEGGGDGEESSDAVDWSVLTFDHHEGLVAGLPLVLPLFNAARERGSKVGVTIVGLGGGVFPMFLHSHFPAMSVDVVELDPAIVEVAKECFEFKEDERMRVHVGDGLEYIARAAERCAECQDTSGGNGVELAHIIVIDVDSKDVSVGMSCPPAAFVAHDFLRQCHGLLHDDGVLMLNVVCRSAPLFEQTKRNIMSVFPQVLQHSMEEDVNRLLFCFKQEMRRPCEARHIESVGSSLCDTLPSSSASVIAAMLKGKVMKEISAPDKSSNKRVGAGTGPARKKGGGKGRGANKKKKKGRR